MIDGFFPSCPYLKLEETKLALTRYAGVMPYLSFTPELARSVKSFSKEQAERYDEKYKEMTWVSRLLYDSNEDVNALDRKIKKIEYREVFKKFHPQVFIDELHDFKMLPQRSNLLEAVFNIVNGFKLEDWTRFLKTTLNTQKVFESIAALYYECSLNNRQIGGFNVLENLKLAFEIKNEFIRKIALRITFIYKENSEHSFSESQFQLEKLNAYVLADGKEPITLIEHLVEEKNEVIMRAILNELEIPTVDGLIHYFINKKHTRNIEFLTRFPHEIKDEKIKTLIQQFPSPPRRNTTVNNSDISDTEGFYFVERRLQ